MLINQLRSLLSKQINMKKTLLTLLLITSAISSFAQGTITFNNRVTGSILAPVYGPDPANQTLRKSGQSSIGTPAGSQTYGGALLNGTGFSAQLWGGASGTPVDSLAALSAVTPFRTGAGAGYFTAIADVQNPSVSAGSVATIQVRAWDNNSGQITTWAAALMGGRAIGASDAFQTAPLGGNPPGGGLPITAPNLVGLTSFNLTVVPEPGVIALGVLGLGALLLRRRK